MALTTVAVLAAGCSSTTVTDTGETPAAGPVGTSTTPSAPPPSNAHLANAFDYVAHPSGGTNYYFISPSGAWACAIIPRVKAGCQSVNNWPSGLDITGAPDSVPDATGEKAPNAVVVPREGDARFVALEQPEFALKPGPAKVLPFNRILAAAGFRCNVQEATGVSCLSEFSGKGFTFSTDGFTPRYTDVPVGAP
ncbi:hypothetical protein H7J93_03720 [Mycobacterium barrassiae]|uniref:hypothetical protein n=1 Tax=Mycobacterium barrassiae TaxID=319709 RepID=UPI0022658F8B|nr:hypothetical protein [Mycobacterium barrassiae]MCV7298741.1 hypothetical protein [Mycobacterium barrassiae]